MKEDLKTKAEEVKPENSERNDQPLSPEQIAEISGGSSDPCEGGQIRNR